MNELLGKKVTLIEHKDLSDYYYGAPGTIIRIRTEKRDIFDSAGSLVKAESETTYLVRFSCVCPKPRSKALRVYRDMFTVDEDQSNPDEDTVNQGLVIRTETVTEYDN